MDNNINRCNFRYYKELILQLYQADIQTLNPANAAIGFSGRQNCFLLLLNDRAIVTIDDRTYRNHNFFFIWPGLPFTILPMGEKAEYLLLEFDLFTCEESYLPTSGTRIEPEKTYTRTYHYMDLELPETPNIHITSEHGGILNILLERITAELRQRQYGYLLQLKSLVAQLIVESFRNNQYSDRTLFRVDSLSLSSSSNHDLPLPAGTAVWISNIQIYDADTAESNLIGVMTVQNVYLNQKHTKNGLSIRYEIDTDTLVNGKPTGKISAVKDSEYFVYFFQQAHFKPIDLRAYKESGRIEFSMKSNKPVSLGFNIVNTDNYMPLTSILDIPEADTWVTFRIPLLRTRADSIQSPLIRQARSYIEQNYMNRVSLQEVASHIHANPDYLSRKFKEQTGTSLRDYIVTYRITIAKTLLLKTDMKVEQIALDTGFYDLPQFARTFKKIVGIKPSAFRKLGKS